MKNSEFVETYGCDVCSERKNWDNEIIWLTSTYGVCEKCYDALPKDKIEEILKTNE